MKRTLGIISVLVLLAAGSAYADELKPGTYRCSSYNVSVGGGSCANMQPLVLTSDGTYKFSSTTGRWRVQDGKLILSNSKLWGSGEILGPDTVSFEYDYQGRHHTVTWICRECASSGNSSGGSYVGVSLVLNFDSNISGVSTFIIVPEESASTYSRHNPLPQGAVSGLAIEKNRNTVALGTNRNNKIKTGKRYVVFLEWTSETRPVAILDLPAKTGADYTATLKATLDSASVLNQLKTGRTGPR